MSQSLYRVRRLVRRGTLVTGLLTLFMAAGTPLAFARALQTHGESGGANGVDRPRPGEVMVEGRVEAPFVSGANAAVPDGTFTLDVEKIIAADGGITASPDAAPRTVHVDAATRLVGVDSRQPMVRADLDSDAVVRVVGRPRGKTGDLDARAILLQKTASEALGQNLLQPKSWLSYIEPGTAEGTFDTDIDKSGALRGTLTKTDGTEWHVQMGQFLTPKTGSQYTLRFRARADVPRVIGIDGRSGATGGAYINLGLNQTLPLDTDWRACRIVFTAKEAPPGNSVVPDFLIGGHTGSVYFADIALVEGAHPVPVAARPVQPAGANLLIDPSETNCWLLRSIDPAAADLSADNKTLKVVVTTLDSEKHPYGVQLYQMVELEEGRRYTLRFIARADASRTLGIATGLDNGDYHVAGLDKTVTVGVDFRPVEMTFTARKPEPGHTKAPCFYFGTATGTVWLANIVLTPSP